MARAEIQYGEMMLDAMPLMRAVPRPDVTQHFTLAAAGDTLAADDHHGFYLELALADGGVRPSYLRLAVALHTGEKTERVWPVSFGEAPVAAFFREDHATINWLVQNLPGPEAERLMTLARPPPVPASGIERAASIPLALTVELCCLLEERLMVVTGSLNEGDLPLTTARLTLGKQVIDLLGSLARSGSPDPKALGTLGGEARAQARISLVVAVPGTTAGTEAVLDLGAGPKTLRVRRVMSRSSAGRQELSAALNTLNADAAIDLLERIAVLVEESPDAVQRFDWLAAEHRNAVERLPTSLQSTSPFYQLHVDSAVPVGEEGVYVNGWFYASEGTVRAVAAHSGTMSRIIDDTWVRAARNDVTTYLAGMGVTAADLQHGYVTYVPLKKSAMPYVISLTSTEGAVRRLRLVTGAAAGGLQTVRSLLTSFGGKHRALCELMDAHVGPAVAAAWSARRRPQSRVTVQSFGPKIPNPRVSVIVPLYGRHDFADYQLALFANDPDFQSFELIYMVDDPAIYDEFRLLCNDLYGMYRVPFTLAFAGANLGFAGANNAAAAVAKGRHLLLLNSDVMPKNPGWVGEMLLLYASLQDPGVLGVKLLYEDGSLQHAGISFKRHAPWGDLWLNDHVHKGQSAFGLTGVRQVDAATAACILVETDLYRELGGLSEDYIIGDFEDSDFCLRAAAAGRRNWVALDIELYHLERQSQDRVGDALFRSNLTLFNCWQHHQRWGAQLDRSAKVTSPAKNLEP